MRDLRRIHIIIYTVFLFLPFTTHCSKGHERLIKRENERVKELSEKLGINPVDKKIVTLQLDGLLTDSDLKHLGFKNVKRRVVNLRDYQELLEEVFISDANDNVLAYLEVRQFVSADAAQSQLINDLAISNAPMDVMLKLYKSDPKGPGTLCVVPILPERSKESPSYPQTYFVHYLIKNIVVSVNAFNKDIDPMEIARKIETMLKN